MEKNDEFVCSVCKKKESDCTKVLTCMYCFSSVHFKCKNVVGNAIRRMKETDYFCCPDCSAIYQRIVMMQNSNKSLLSSLAAEMKATISTSVAVELRSVTTEVKQITTAIEKSQEFLSTKFEQIVTDFNNLKLENAKLKTEIQHLKKSQNRLQGMVYKLEANVDKSDKTDLVNNAILWGIPSATDENVLDSVKKYFNCLGLKDNFNCVLSAERIFSNKNTNVLVPIRIVFQNKETKEFVFNKKKQFGKLLSTSIDHKFTVNGRSLNVTLRDELTPLSLELFKELRESQESLRIKYVWVGRGGIILVKKDDSSKPEYVKNREDLNRIMFHSMNITCVTESLSTSGPSPKQKKGTN